MPDFTKKNYSFSLYLLILPSSTNKVLLTTLFSRKGI